MKVYLCAQFAEQKLMRKWRELLNVHGHEVTSRWLDAQVAELGSTQSQNAGMIDLQDIDRCQIVLSKTINRGDMFTGGGRHFEAGYAFAMGKILINVGGKENVFHDLPSVTTVNTIANAILLINDYQNDFPTMLGQM